MHVDQIGRSPVRSVINADLNIRDAPGSRPRSSLECMPPRREKPVPGNQIRYARRHDNRRRREPGVADLEPVGARRKRELGQRRRDAALAAVDVDLAPRGNREPDAPDDVWYRANGVTGVRPLTALAREADSYAGSEIDLIVQWAVS